MNFFKGLWRGVVSISKRVLSVFGRALQSYVAAEAAGYYQTVLATVREAESRGGSGQAKYEWVLSVIRDRLAAQWQQTPARALDFAIHMAVAEISNPSAAPSNGPGN